MYKIEMLRYGRLDCLLKETLVFPLGDLLAPI